MRTRKNLVFLNPDIIAAGISPLDSEKASFKAGRILIHEVKSRIAGGSDFSFETTMAGKTWLTFLKEAKDQGYEINIYFLFVTSIDKSLERIDSRVQLGGHNIPKASVLRRYPRCFANFWYRYRALADNWYIFDNTDDEPRMVMSSGDFDYLDDDKKDGFVQAFLEGKIYDL